MEMRTTFWGKLRQSSSFLPRLVFKYLGVSTDDDGDGFLYKFYAVFVLSISSTYPVNNLFVLLQNVDDFDIIIRSLYNLVGGLMAFMKIVVILYNRKNLGRTLSKIEQLQIDRNTKQWSQMETYGTNKLTMACLSILFFSLLYFFVGTLMGKMVNDDPSKWTLPISDVSFINRTYSPNFEIAWAYQVIAVSILAPAFCLSDFLVAGVAADMCIQLKIIPENFKKAVREVQATQKGLDENLSWKCLKRILKEMVTHHLALINLAKEIEGIFSVLVFLDVFGNMSMICFAVYYASVLPLFNFNAMQIYLEVFAITSSLFFICYWGTEIELASQAMANACYEINFIDTDIRFQKSLIMIILRCRKPITISVGRFTTLSISVFAWIIRNSYTYLMVLRKTNESNERFE